MKAYFALLIAILLTVGLMSDPLYAKDAKKTAGKCPGGMRPAMRRRWRSIEALSGLLPKDARLLTKSAKYGRIGIERPYHV